MCDMQKPMVLTITVLITSALIASTFALQTIYQNIPGSGSIKGLGVGVYLNQQCTNPASSVAFGLLEPGSSKDFPLYLRNEGNADLTLALTSDNWVPTEAEDYMTLTWNREGQQIGSGDVMSCVLTLSVSSEIQGITTFDLDIIISATG
jgi:hypothetical protein